MKNNLKSKKGIFCAFICFSPQLFCKPHEGRKCTPHKTSIIVRLLLLGQNRCCETHRGPQSGDCSSYYAKEKKLQEITPTTLPRAGQKPK